MREKNIPGEVAKSTADKLEAVFRRYPDVAQIEQVGQVLRGDNVQENFLWNPEEIASMKYGIFGISENFDRR